MANYSIVIGSKFKPFSYQELLHPVMTATQAQQQVEEAYAALATQAGLAASEVNEATDKETYGKYKAYSDELNRLSERLARNGLTPEDRKTMYGMRARYANEIMPIEKAIKARQEDARLQKEAFYKSNGRAVFTRNAGEVSLDDYLNGNVPQYGMTNLDVVAQETMAGTAAISKRYFNTSEGRRFNNDYFSLVNEQGINAEDAKQIMMGNLNKYPELAAYIANERGKIGINNYSQDSQRAIDNAIMQGVNAGLFYDRKESLQDNWERKLAMQDYYDAKHQRRAHEYAMAEATAGQSDWQGIQGDTIPVHFTEGASEKVKEQMANQTFDVFVKARNNGNKAASDFLSKFKNREEAVKYLATNGYNFKGLKGSKDDKALYYLVGNALRDNITKDEGLINIWRSGYSNNTRPTGGQRPSLTSNGARKDWGDFDARTKNAYTVNAVGFKDDRTNLSKYLEKTFTQIAAGNDSYKMYDIKKIKSDNSYEYSNTPVKKKDLPRKTSNGKEVIDYDRIYRAQLSNGDFMLYWVDDKGNPVEKVIKRSDLPKEASANWNNRSQGYDALMQDYAQGIISYETMQAGLGRLGDNTLANDYYLLQGVDVKDQELK